MQGKDPQKLRWLILGGLTAGMVMVAATGATLYGLSVQMVNARELVFESQDKIVAITDLRATIKDLETEQRGFLITGDPVYLTSYDVQKNSIPEQVKSVVDKTTTQLSTQTLLSTLTAKINARIADLDEAMRVRKEADFKAAAHVIQSNRGLEEMTDLRKDIQEILSIENESLNDANAQLVSKTSSFFELFVTLAAFVVALFIGFACFMRRYFKDLDEAHQKVLKHNSRLSEFYSVLAHELRTPMTSIRGALGLIDGGMAGELPERSKKLISIASDETQRMLRLINELLDLEKIESGKLELKLVTVEPAGILNLTLSGMQGMAAEANVQLIDEVNANNPIQCDVDRIVQVLTNLISNAIKFSAPNDHVTVSIDDDNGERIKFSVKDVGPGIPREQQHKVFQKFQQMENSKSAYKGTGLGLAISKSIAEIHGGDIGFESEVGRGTTFWVALPTSESATALR